MSDDTSANYVYNGLGFPIELKNVEMVRFADESHPLIDVKKVAAAALESLRTQTTEYTGGQIAFVRVYFSMTRKELAALVKVPVNVVQQWERRPDKTVDMSSESKNLLKQHIEVNKHEASQLIASKGFFSQKPQKPQSPPVADSDNTDAPKKKR
jgi:DNA-binding transcriptional regulator YiaG